MSKKFILALLLIVFSSVFASAGGVTNIKEVVNRSSKFVRLSTFENKTLAENGLKNLLATPEIAGGGTWTGDLWIPWADNAEEYKTHYMTISFDGKPLFWLWQEGASIRFRAREGYMQNAPEAPGLSKSGGDRTLFIEVVNNTPIFVFSSN